MLTTTRQPRLAKVTTELPTGIETQLVANQPEVVEEAVIVGTTYTLPAGTPT